MSFTSQNKIRTRDELISIVSQARTNKKRVGFTSGTFDLLHPGHVDYLEKARQKVDLLIVAINSDLSVRSYKDPDRPISNQTDRARVVAALGCVDYVFVFDELNNNLNIELLKPDLYIKAGDYKKEQLSSAKLVEQYGGEVVLIPLLEGHSTTRLIEHIQGKLGEQIAKARSGAPCRAVFIDRDGTINEEIEYLHDPKQVRIIPGAAQAIRDLSAAGFKIVIVTNQPGIGFGYYSKEDLFKVNKVILTAISKAGGTVNKILFCPHTKADECECRKPKPGMLIRAGQDLNIDLSQSFMIGDSSADIAAGDAAGCQTILVQTGKGGGDGLANATPTCTVASLKEASELILSQN